MSNWFDKFTNKGIRERQREQERIRNEKRPVKWIEEKPNVWRIVYADDGEHV